MSKNILFVVEGEKSETRFMQKLISVFIRDVQPEFFHYKTNIHQMIDGMMNDDGRIDEDLDFIEHLRSCGTNKGDRSVLNRKFTDVFLFFDMDPQDQKYDAEKMQSVLDYFSDPSDNGKLYVNYPMLESYKHVSDLNSLSFLDTKVNREDIRRYKSIVDAEALSSLKDLSKITEEMWKRLLTLNVIKANMICNGIEDLPDMEQYENTIKQDTIFRIQSKHLEKDGFLFVMNTSLFYIVDYKGESILSMLSSLEF